MSRSIPIRSTLRLPSDAAAFESSSIGSRHSRIAPRAAHARHARQRARAWGTRPCTGGVAAELEHRELDGVWKSLERRPLDELAFLRACAPFELAQTPREARVLGAQRLEKRTLRLARGASTPELL